MKKNGVLRISTTCGEVYLYDTINKKVKIKGFKNEDQWDNLDTSTFTILNLFNGEQFVYKEKTPIRTKIYVSIGKVLEITSNSLYED